MRNLRLRLKRRGLSLLELLVTCGLVSIIGIFILQLYFSAQTEFEHTSGTINLSQHARQITAKMIPILTSACPYPSIDESGILVPPGNAFGKDFYECDFLCSKYVVADPNPAANHGSSWQVSQRYWVDSTLGDRITYEPDEVNLSSRNTRDPSIYRYRFLWRPLTDTDYPSIAKRSIVFERLKTEGGVAGAGSVSRPMNSSGIPDPLRPIVPGTARRVISYKVSLMAIQRQTIDSLQLRIRIYNVDPDVWNSGPTNDAIRREAILDGSMMRGLNRQVRFRSYDLTTSVPLPAATVL